MAPTKTSWDDEEESSSGESSPAPVAAVRRGKFDDEEDEDVLESWDAAEDSDEEREKAKKAAEAKAKAEAAAKANHKSKSQRVEEIRNQRLRQRAEEEDEESEEEDEAEKRARVRASEKASDMQHAEELFGGVGGVPDSRGASKAVTVQQGDDPSDTVDLASLKIFNPQTAAQFAKLRETLVPLLNQNGKKASYEGFMKEFTKQIVRDLNSEQVKKIASGLTAISNEKMKEEKAAEKGGKKTKAAKTKTTLNASRNVAREADTAAYDDGLEDDDFM
ncbi:Eukaryotic translation initiation factor 3 subunit J [Lecanosticta acicola]|uniref:Eukaryotic translation initiation factor 3 subunit J n=1 Tax=Lecanosticta acicola TaxID=111012 RepID=A0AAI8Z8N0_9PEZI|nr:Eukaryotic translation initiation factor 3 subunit J [Lecanosticta acicola]